MCVPLTRCGRKTSRSPCVLWRRIHLLGVYMCAGVRVRAFRTSLLSLSLSVSLAISLSLFVSAYISDLLGAHCALAFETNPTGATVTVMATVTTQTTVTAMSPRALGQGWRREGGGAGGGGKHNAQIGTVAVYEDRVLDERKVNL